MGYDHEASVEALEVIQKPRHGFDIQVVCRLVQKKKVRILHKDSCQCDPHLISAAELPGFTGKVGDVETKTHENGFDTGFSVPVAAVHKSLVQFR